MYKIIIALLFLCACALAEKPAVSSAPFPPAEISGMYTFLREGEFVQINIEEQNQVTGFISRFGEVDSDRGAFLDHFFTKAAMEGRRISFETRAVHGVSYSFKGVVDRGEGKTPAQEGYYVLKGTLTQYTTEANKKTSAKAREVTFKSFPQDATSDRPPDD